MLYLKFEQKLTSGPLKNIWTFCTSWNGSNFLCWIKKGTFSISSHGDFLCLLKLNVKWVVANISHDLEMIADLSTNKYQLNEKKIDK